MAKEFTYFNPSATILWRDSTVTENTSLGLKNDTNVLIHDITLNEPYQTDYSWDIKLVMSNWNSAFLWLDCTIPNSFNNIDNYYHIVIEDITDNKEVLKKVWHDSIPFNQDSHGIEIITFHEYKIKIYQIKDQYKEIHPSYSDPLWWESDIFEFPYIFINYDFIGSLCSIDIRNKYIPSLNTSDNHYCIRDTSMTQTPRFFIKSDGLFFKEEEIDINQRQFTKYNYLYKDMDLSFSGDLPLYFTDPGNLTKAKYNIGYKYDRYILGEHQNSQLSTMDDYKLELVDITSPTNVEYNSTDGYYYINRKMDHEFKISCIIHNDSITSEPTNMNAYKTYSTSFDDSNVSFIKDNLVEKQTYYDVTKDYYGRIVGIRERKSIFMKDTNKQFIKNDLYFIKINILNINYGSIISYNIIDGFRNTFIYYNYEYTGNFQRHYWEPTYKVFEIDIDIELIDIFNNKYNYNLKNKIYIRI